MDGKNGGLTIVGLMFLVCFVLTGFFLFQFRDGGILADDSASKNEIKKLLDQNRQQVLSEVRQSEYRLKEEIASLKKDNKKLRKELTEQIDKSNPNILHDVVFPAAEKITTYLNTPVPNITYIAKQPIKVKEENHFDAKSLFPIWKRETEKVFYEESPEAIKIKTESYQDLAVMIVEIDTTLTSYSKTDQLYQSFRQFGWEKRGSSPVYRRSGEGHGGLYIVKLDGRFTIVLSSIELLYLGRYKGPWYKPDHQEIKAVLEAFYFDLDYPLDQNETILFNNGSPVVIQTEEP